MKKVLLSAILLMAMLPMMAQNNVTYRHGNTYIVGGDVMNKQAYEGFLQNTNPAAFAKFHSGRVTATAGWALFGTGLAMDFGGLIMVGASSMSTSGEQKLDGLALGGVVMSVVGSTMTTASIICLGVGYARMHNAADLYNATVQNKNAQAYISLDAVPGGIGVGVHF